MSGVILSVDANQFMIFDHVMSTRGEANEWTTEEYLKSVAIFEKKTGIGPDTLNENGEEVSIKCCTTIKSIEGDLIEKIDKLFAEGVSDDLDKKNHAHKEPAIPK